MNSVSTRLRFRPARGERGAILIHVALALVAMLAFSGLVIDQGILYVARAQAQNAADAGTLAALTTLQKNAGATAEAAVAARYFAGQNAVWGQATADADIVVPTLPVACPDGSLSCVRVDVLRGVPDRSGTGHSNTIPTFLMRMFGVSNQGVRATAMGQIAGANYVSCIKPFAVADRWTDNSGTGSNKTGWDQDDEFNLGVDTYSSASGFNATVGSDFGLELTLKGDDDFSASWSNEVDLGGGNGANVLEDEIGGCPNYVPSVGLYDGSTPCTGRSDLNYDKGCLNVKPGVKEGPTRKGIEDLVALDPSSSWSTVNNNVQGGCGPSNTCVNKEGRSISMSPRIVPMAIFNPQAFVASSCGGNNCMVQVVNIIGFFVEGMCDDVYQSPPSWCGKHPSKTVIGRMMTYPGSYSSAAGAAGNATFLKTTRLIR